MDKLEFIERTPKANADFHIATTEYLAKEAQQTLTLLLSGAAGGTAYGISLFDKGTTWAAAGMFASAAWLFILSFVIVYHCMRIRPISPPANEPSQLLKANTDEWKLDELREAHLHTLQRSIERYRERNDTVGTWLNRVRMAAPGVAIVFTLAAACTYRLAVHPGG